MTEEPKRIQITSDHELVLAIQDLMDGTAWDADTLQEIARLLVSMGYQLHDLDGRLYDDEEPAEQPIDIPTSSKERAALARVLMHSGPIIDERTARSILEKLRAAG
jgi:hypothetical protein